MVPAGHAGFSGALCSPADSEVEIDRLVAAGFDEAQQAARRQGQGHVVGQGVAMQGVHRQERPVQHRLHLMRLVIDEGERRHRARQHPQIGHEPVGTAEGKLVAADPGRQRLQIHAARLLHHDQPHLVALLVAQEQVLDMAAGQVAAQRLGFLDGKDRRMAMDLGLDAEIGQALDHGFRAGRQDGGGRSGGIGHGKGFGSGVVARVVRGASLRGRRHPRQPRRPPKPPKPRRTSPKNGGILRLRDKRSHLKPLATAGLQC
jgi:hypothetical protein